MTDPDTTWQTFLAQHGPAALLYARHLTATLADAEDALHDAFLRFWPKRHTAKDPRALFFTCLRTAALDQHRTNRRRHAREQSTKAEIPLFAANTHDDLEKRDLVQHALQQLPDDQREVVILKLWANLTFDQIAQTTSVPLNTAAARYRYALEKLAPLLSLENTK